MSDRTPPEEQRTDTREEQIIPDPGNGGNVPHDTAVVRSRADPHPPDTATGESQASYLPPDTTTGESRLLPDAVPTGQVHTDTVDKIAVPSHPDDAKDDGGQQPVEISLVPGNGNSVPVSRPLPVTFRQMGPSLLAVAFLFAVAVIAGVIIAVRDPSIGTTLMDIFRDTILGGIDESNPFALAFAIFLNNLQACILLFLGGASFGILTVFILGTNGLVIGAILELVRQEKGTLFVIAAILPHGILEIPAFLISGALGLMLAGSLWQEWHGHEDAAAAATRSGRLFITIVVPVVVLAAFIEAFITPHIIDLVI